MQAEEDDGSEPVEIPEETEKQGQADEWVIPGLSPVDARSRLQTPGASPKGGRRLFPVEPGVYPEQLKELLQNVSKRYYVKDGCGFL